MCTGVCVCVWGVFLCICTGKSVYVHEYAVWNLEVCLSSDTRERRGEIGVGWGRKPQRRIWLSLHVSVLSFGVSVDVYGSLSLRQ